jgi:hypothetical protein
VSPLRENAKVHTETLYTFTPGVISTVEEVMTSQSFRKELTVVWGARFDAVGVSLISPRVFCNGRLLCADQRAPHATYTPPTWDHIIGRPRSVLSTSWLLRMRPGSRTARCC